LKMATPVTIVSKIKANAPPATKNTISQFMCDQARCPAVPFGAQHQPLPPHANEPWHESIPPGAKVVPGHPSVIGQVQVVFVKTICHHPVAAYDPGDWTLAEEQRLFEKLDRLA
jgi:hypothetical protein